MIAYLSSFIFLIFFCYRDCLAELTNDFTDINDVNIIPENNAFIDNFFQKSLPKNEDNLMNVNEDTYDLVDDLADINTAAVVTEKSPILINLSGQFKHLILQADKSQRIGMEEWIEYVWDEPYHQGVVN